MLLTSHPSLKELIVECLSNAPLCSAKALQQKLASRGKDFTIQAVYQELRKLSAAGVVTKSGDRFSLRYGWILELLSMAEKMSTSHLNPSNLRRMLPSDGETVTYEFSSLSRVVSFYGHVGLLLLQESVHRRALEYVPHIWYHLADQVAESQFMKASIRSGFQSYIVVANDSPLDRSYEKFTRSFPVKVSYGHTPLPSRFKERYVAVIDDFICTLKVDTALAARIDSIFSRTRLSHIRGALIHKGTSEENPLSRIYALFNTKGKIRITIEKNYSLAHSLTRAFERFFGERFLLEPISRLPTNGRF